MEGRTEEHEEHTASKAPSSITRTDQLSPQAYHCLGAQGVSLVFLQTANYRKNLWLTDHKVVRNQRDSEEMPFC